MSSEAWTAFLAARLDEDEAEAWDVHEGSCATAGPISFPCDCTYPARVLREVEAKRKILGLHRPTQPDPEFGFTYPAAAKFCGYDGPGDNWQAEQEPDHFPDALWPCLTVRYLAAVYSSHPDYAKLLTAATT